MGTIIDKTVICTGWYGDEETFSASTYALVYAEAVELFGDQVTPIMKHLVNGEASFFICSSGSKLGWEPAKKQDDYIDDLLEFNYSLKHSVTILVIGHGETTPQIIHS